MKDLLEKRRKSAEKKKELEKEKMIFQLAAVNQLSEKFEAGT